MYSLQFDKANLKSKANDLRIEISENLKQTQSIELLVSQLKMQDIHPVFDPNTRFRISFALRKDYVPVMSDSYSLPIPLTSLLTMTNGHGRRPS